MLLNTRAASRFRYSASDCVMLFSCRQSSRMSDDILQVFKVWASLLSLQNPLIPRRGKIVVPCVNRTCIASVEEIGFLLSVCRFVSATDENGHS